MSTEPGISPGTAEWAPNSTPAPNACDDNNSKMDLVENLKGTGYRPTGCTFLLSEEGDRNVTSSPAVCARSSEL